MMVVRFVSDVLPIRGLAGCVEDDWTWEAWGRRLRCLDTGAERGRGIGRRVTVGLGSTIGGTMAGK